MIFLHFWTCIFSGVFRMCERRGPRGSGGRSPPEADVFCYWMPKFWCFRRKKSVKQPKIPSKNYGRLKGGQAQAPFPLNTPVCILLLLLLIQRKIRCLWLIVGKRLVVAVSVIVSARRRLCMCLLLLLLPIFGCSVYSVSYTHLTLPTNREV